MKKNGLLIAILFLVIGFAAVSTTLYINGTVLIAGDQNEFDVYYSNAYINGVENKGVITSDKTISFNKEFKTVNETYILKYDITNGSKNYNADVSINCSDGNDYISVVNSWIDNTIINATETKSGTLTLTMTKGYTGDNALELDIECEIDVKAVERESLGVGTPADKVVKVPGMYDSSWNLVSTWSDSGVNIEKDYEYNTYNTDSESMYVYLENHPEVVNVVIPNDITYIGERAFLNTLSLESIILPNSITSIGESSFSGTGVKSIILPESLTSINDWAFAGARLTYINIPGNILSIGSYAFTGTRLERVDISEGVVELGDHVFVGVPTLKKVSLPNTLTTIGNSAFAQTALTSVTIPGSVKTISYYAFGNCVDLESLTIMEGVEVIEGSAFTCYSAPSKLTNIVLPNSIKEIKEAAFSNYEDNSTNIVVPNTVEIVEEDAFYNVNHLTYNGSLSTTSWGALSIN